MSAIPGLIATMIATNTVEHNLRNTSLRSQVSFNGHMDKVGMSYGSCQVLVSGGNGDVLVSYDSEED
jgi:hypothetical protein